MAERGGSLAAETGREAHCLPIMATIASDHYLSLGKDQKEKVFLNYLRR